jgi:hypothetical protein
MNKTDNQGRPRSDYTDRLAAMTDGELLAEAKSKIWLSAYANNNPRSDYHWQADACWAESEKRTPGEAKVYRKAWDHEYSAAGGRA